jgi:hypothetical protein
MSLAIKGLTGWYIPMDLDRAPASGKEDGLAVCGPVADSISHCWFTPGWPGSRSGPEVWARRWAQFAPCLNYMQGVKDLGVDKEAGDLVGADFAGVSSERKL